MSFLESLRRIPRWQLGVTGGLLLWAAGLQVSSPHGVAQNGYSSVQQHKNAHDAVTGAAQAHACVYLLSRYMLSTMHGYDAMNVAAVAHSQRQAGIRGEVLGPAAAGASRGGGQSAAQAAGQQAVYLVQAARRRFRVASSGHIASAGRAGAVHGRQPPLAVRRAASRAWRFRRRNQGVTHVHCD